MSVTKSKTDYLRIFNETPPEAPPTETQGPDSLSAVLSAFQKITGWKLRYLPGSGPKQPANLTWSTPVNPGVGATPGHLRLEPAESASGGSPSSVDSEAVKEFTTALAGMVGELRRTQHVLWKREAELAAGVPLVQHADEQEHLAVRLQAVLKGGAQAVGCQAAGLYLLDEATTSLKLRSAWGLPKARLADPTRPLQGALADLEAMLGHAVVLEDTRLLKRWNSPEDYPSAMCVPVSSSTTILGTLWFFSNSKRDFSDLQTNIVEVVAGRLAADLDREILMREGIEGARLKRQLAAAERAQRNQLPTIAPLIDGWDLAGWNAQSQSVGGDFFDWFALPDGLVAAAVGDVMDQGMEAALIASAVKAALRSHAQYHRNSDVLLNRVNLNLWTGSAGDQFASLFCGLLETATGRVCYSSAGQPSVVLVRPDGCESLSEPSPPLGESPETKYRQLECLLEPGEALVVFTDGFRDAADRQGNPLGEQGLVQPLISKLDRPARELLNIARDRLEAHALVPDRDDRTVLIVKRTHT